MESQMQTVARLLEEEIAHYEKLIAALKKEADCLRRGSPEELLGSVKAASGSAEAISRIHRDIRGKVEEILNSAGKEKAGKPFQELLLLLPPPEARRLQRSQETLNRLRSWAAQMNTRNKAFVQTALAHWRELFSLLIPAAAASPVYAPQGVKNPPRQMPVSLDRKV
jgi:hypothetical protein